MSVIVWQTARLISIILLLVQVFSSSVQAEDQVSTRAQRRELIPLDRLKVFLDAPKRVQTMQPERIIGLLGVQQGETVADIGAGTGFFSLYMAAAVGTAGRVYAVEIEDELLAVIQEKIEKQNIPNIVPVKSSETAPNLPQGCCDRILIANTYIYFDDPVTFMKKVHQALQPEGTIGIVEVDAVKAQSKRKLLLRTKGRLAGEVIDEMKTAGFELRESYDFLESRFFLVFTRLD